MADITPEDIAAKLRTEGNTYAGAVADALSDPAADTPMVVTLDQLRPFDLNPRVGRNPLYEDIKSSIKERGLDSPPSITRRPGAPHYMIRNGGNTRLAILRDLWTETRDERFYRIPCLFRPWSSRGDIVLLTGHLAENELRGQLSFIERANGVEKARSLYEQEYHKSLSQNELAQRLTADGYPVHQSHISRMQEAIRYLLPAIPTLLYEGLGRPQVERLSQLRRAAARSWDLRQPPGGAALSYEALFQEVLAEFDQDGSAFSVDRVQDELVGRMAELLGADYDTINLDIEAPATLTRVTPPAPPPPAEPEPSPAKPRSSSTSTAGSAPEGSPTTETPLPSSEDDGRLGHGHDFVNPVPSEFHLAEGAPLVIETAPFTPERPEELREAIAQHAITLAREGGIADRVIPLARHIGFYCLPVDQGAPPASATGQAIATLLHALSGSVFTTESAHTAIPLAEVLAPLLVGSFPSRNDDAPSDVERIGDDALQALFQLVVLARRLTPPQTVITVPART